MRARFQNTTPTYTCHACQKVTRDTGTGEAATELCRLCYWRAVVENAESDYGPNDVPQDYRDQLAAAKWAAVAPNAGRPMRSPGRPDWNRK